MLIWCESGPPIGRAVVYAPPLETDVTGGAYILVDDGPPEQWRHDYVEVADSR